MLLCLRRLTSRKVIGQSYLAEMVQRQRVDAALAAVATSPSMDEPEQESCTARQRAAELQRHQLANKHQRVQLEVCVPVGS